LIQQDISKGYGKAKKLSVTSMMMQPFESGAVSSECAVYAWGAGIEGLRVAGQASMLPQEIDLGHRVEKLACGLDFVAFVSNEQQVFAFGSAEWGQSGGNQKINRIQFVQENGRDVDKVDLVQDITCGDQFCIVTGKGYSVEGSTGVRVQKVFAWGRNDQGQLGVGSQEKALVVPGRLDRFLNMDDEAAKVIRCGSAHSIILTDKGRVFSFGSNKCGQLGVQLGSKSHVSYPVYMNLSSKCLPIIDVALGSEHTLLLTSSHQILAFGQNTSG